MVCLRANQCSQSALHGSSRDQQEYWYVLATSQMAVWFRVGIHTQNVPERMHTLLRTQNLRCFYAFLYLMCCVRDTMGYLMDPT